MTFRLGEILSGMTSEEDARCRPLSLHMGMHACAHSLWLPVAMLPSAVCRVSSLSEWVVYKDQGTHLCLGASVMVRGLWDVWSLEKWMCNLCVAEWYPRSLVSDL